MNLTTDPLFAITGSPAITLAAGGSASVQLTFVANAAYSFRNTPTRPRLRYTSSPAAYPRPEHSGEHVPGSV